jgi:hypothetical protein
MSLATTFEWRWRARAEAPPAQAAVAWGAASRVLHARLRQFEPEQQAGLSATASRELLIVVGEGSALPWVDGIAYAAPCTDAPGLWLPTLEEPDLPADLIARSLQRHHQGRQPLLLWPRPEAVLPLDRLMPLSSALLARIEVHWAGGAA